MTLPCWSSSSFGACHPGSRLSGHYPGLLSGCWCLIQRCAAEVPPRNTPPYRRLLHSHITYGVPCSPSLAIPAVLATLDTIVDYFRDAGVSFNAVRLRRHPTSKQFKGSLFIELDTKEEADRVSHCVRGPSSFSPCLLSPLFCAVVGR
jgi:hypothetical protein